jgi:4-amino-4-deoxy-L-arabinose transferase-like glycosyltransferase
MRIEPLHRHELAALVIVVALAAILRLGWPTITEFKLDESLIAGHALDIAEGRHFPLQGSVGSTGLPLPPLGLYIYALPFLISPNPLAASLFTAVWNVLGVALCWWIGRRYWGPIAGLAAALLFAVNPWAVFFSRKIWEPNLLPPFVAAYLLTAIMGFVEGKSWALVAHLALLGIVVLIYYSALPLILVSAILVLLYHRRIQRRAMLIGLGAAALVAVPFGVYIAQHWQGVHSALVGLLARPVAIDWQALRLWWTLVAGSHIHSLAGHPAYLAFLGSLPHALAGAPVLIGALVVASIGWGLLRALRLRSEAPVQAAGIMALAALAPVVLFTAHYTPLHLHYFIAAWPATFLAVGALCAQTAPLKLRWRALGGGMLVLLAAAHVAVFLALLNFVMRNPTPGGFGAPLAYSQRAARQALAQGDPIVVLSGGDDPSMRTWPGVFDVLLRRTPHRFVDGSYTALFPATPSSLLVAPDAETALEIYRHIQPAESFAPVYARRGEPPFYLRKAAVQPDLRWRPAPEPRLLSNGAEWVGYRVDAAPQPGKGFAWWIAWRVARPPPHPRARYHIFNHLLDASGKRWDQRDCFTIPSKDWQSGDLVVQVFHMQLPTDAPVGDYHMRVGMYTYPQLQAQPVLDVAGNPAADYVVLGPLAAE